MAAVSGGPALIVVSRTEPARRLLRLLLAQCGWQARCVADGDAALELLAASPTAVVVVDARAPTEEELLLLGLLERRHPGVGRLVLHEGLGRLVCGGAEERLTWEPSLHGGMTPAFPSQPELKRAVERLQAECLLATLKPPTGSA